MLLLMQQRYHLSTHELTVCRAAKIDLKATFSFDSLNVLDAADLTTIQFKTDGLVTDINSPIVRKRVFGISESMHPCTPKYISPHQPS